MLELLQYFIISLLIILFGHILYTFLKDLFTKPKINIINNTYSDDYQLIDNIIATDVNTDVDVDVDTNDNSNDDKSNDDKSMHTQLNNYIKNKIKIY